MGKAPVLMLLLGLSCVTAGAQQAPVLATQAQAAADWPQWRGPTRDGVAAPGPKLLDSWPKEGPPLIWKSGPLLSGRWGGSGSISVSGGRAYVYANQLYTKPGEVIVTEEMLKHFGWADGIPDDLAAKVEKAVFDDTNSRVKGADLDKYIASFMSALDEPTRQKYGEWIKSKIQLGRLLRWNIVAILAQQRAKKLTSLEEVMEPLWGPMGHDDSMWLISEQIFKTATCLDTAICLDAATGKELWRKDYPGGPTAMWGHIVPQCSSTPAIVGDRCYFQGSTGFYCLSAKDGAELWKIPTEKNNSSPLIANNVVYILHPKTAAAYDATTGKKIWENGQIGSGWGASFALWPHAGKNYLICAGLACLDATDGKLMWRAPGGDSATPVLVGDTLIHAAGDRLRAYALTPEKATVLWSAPVGDDRLSSPLVCGDYVYQFNHHQFRCVSLKDGKVAWEDGSIATHFPSPVLVDGKIINHIGDTHNALRTVMFQPDGERLVKLAEFDFQAAICSSPTLVDGRMYLRLKDSLACYDLREHGAYLDRVNVTKDALTFQFKQTGGGLTAMDTAADANKDILILDEKDGTKPAKMRIAGDTIVVDLTEAMSPFTVTYAAGGRLTTKSGAPLPAFSWKEARELKFKNCFDHKIRLSSARPLEGDFWSTKTNYGVTGATITGVQVDKSGKEVILTTDKEWKPDDRITLTYPIFPVTEGKPRQGAITASAPKIERATARFIKTDESSGGNWQGVYGAESAIIPGGATVSGKALIVTPNEDKKDYVWKAVTDETRAPQQSAGAKDRIAACWYNNPSFDVDIRVADGKEHQVALYFLDWDDLGRAAKVEVRETATNEILDAQTAVESKAGKYLVWTFKGNVTLHIISVGNENATVSGIFFDLPAGQLK